MNTTNILITGVGGQGLVLATKIIANVAFKHGFDVTTSDVIGLSQRGGKVWGSIRFGDEVLSSLIPEGKCDIIVALEKLEALRWAHMLKPCAQLIINEEVIYPNRVLIEKEEYPKDVEALIEAKHKLYRIDAKALAKIAGNAKAFNIVLLGALSKLLPFKKEDWLVVITDNVPRGTEEINIKAFEAGAASY